ADAVDAEGQRRLALRRPAIGVARQRADCLRLRAAASGTASETDLLRDAARGAGVRDRPSLARRQALFQRVESVAVALAAPVNARDAGAVDVRVDVEQRIARAHLERQCADARGAVRAGVQGRCGRVTAGARTDEVAVAIARRARAAAAGRLTADATKGRRTAPHVR